MSKAKILVVIVLYKRKIHQSISFNCIYSELHAQNDIESKIYIYDNSPYPDEEGMILADDNIIYVHDKTNPGVSKAYNQAARYAELIKCNWILLVIVVLSAVSLVCFSPLENENRMLSREEQVCYKKITVAIVVGFVIVDLLLFLLHLHTYAICVSIGLILSAGLQFPCILKKLICNEK